MTKHTPGPWRVMGMGGRFVVTTAGPTARKIADCGNGFDGYRIDKALRLECQANAHLFSDARETAAERDRLKSRNAELEESLELALAVMKKMKAMQGEIDQLKALNAELLAALQLVAKNGPKMAIAWVSVSGVVHKAIAKAEGSN